MNMFSKRVTAIALTLTVVTGLLSGTGTISKVSAATPVNIGLQDPKEVEQFADEFFNRPEIKDSMAGAAFVVVKGDKVLLKKGYGYADVDKKLPVDPDRTVFRVASISKVITATAVMQLAEQGKIDLNKDVSVYLGDIKIPNKTGTPLTTKHLMTNSTGFEFGDGSELSTDDLTREASIKQYVSDNTPTVIRKPGQYYRYDNLGFTIQGYIVEQVSKQPFGTYVQEHVFKPLGMTNSDFRVTSNITKHLAVPYNVMGEAIPTYATVPTELPGGGMFSTGADMANFMLAHLNGGKLGDATILKTETAAEMHKPQLAVHEKLPNMAYGFEYANQQQYNGRYLIEKSGDMAGYHSNLWLIPDEKVGIFVTVNKDVEFRKDLLEAFMDHYYPKKEGAQAPHERATRSLEKFEGMYSDLRNRMWTSRIRAEDGKLIVKDPFGEHILHEIEPLLFQDEQGVKAAFKLNDSGEVKAFYYDLKSDSWTEKLAAPQQYQDVNDDHPYAPYIYHLRQLKVIDDRSGDNRFQPAQAITREQFIGWFIRWAGVSPSKSKPAFIDISDSSFAKEIQSAYELGVIQKPESGKFHPQELLTRQEAATIIWRMAFNHVGTGPKEARLSGSTDTWAREGVQFVIAKQLFGPEVIQGKDGAFDYRSKQPILKQEAAAMLSTFADNLF
ncbi:penicillin-binding protein [Paenibacillus sp. KS1]|uniref:serine hydrolase n=1 Tax=Paenibacillus sp. KS1 TaxID=1849249 RepID=UPI0008066425|nr:serine hydrolase [Paenibacillus sp. KS1]OBY77285.1 penicillin-binding protein [Paenibacillus sp. KS1]